MFGKRRDRADARRAGALAIALAALIAMVPGGVQAARVVSAVPSGEVGDGAVQIRLRFDAAVVPFGQADAPDPATLACDGLGAAARPAGSRRWIGDREWAWDLDAPLPPGVTCRLAISPSWKPLGGPIQGPQAFHFATGGPSVVSIEPDEGATIEEDQHWLLRLNGPAVPDSVRRHAWCEVQGVGERVPATWVEGAARAALLGSRQIPAAEADRTVVLACQRPLPPAAGVRLVWGAGIAAASQPAVVTRQPRRFGFEVRERFTAEFSCERERAEAPCIPLRPLELRFSAPVPRAQLARVRLQPVGGGAEVAPVAEPAGGDPAPSALRFPVPLAENARYRVALPADFRDESGRALANAAQFPLAVATGPMPPLAKFAAAPFGVLEFGPGEPGMLPITLRHVQEPGGPPPRARVGVKRLGAEASDRDLLQWYARVARHHESNLTAREAGLPPKDWTVTETVTGDDGRPRRVTRDRMVGTRELSLLAGEADVARTDLPVPASGTGRAPGSTEVIGLPLARPGYHVVEVSSQVLGRALLDRDAPMHVRTGVLVTSLGVHFKRGRTDSLVWVTTLDRARPVAGADVAVSDCRGVPLWSGRTDAQGLARIPRGFEEADDRRDCLAHDGLFVTARGPAGVDGARDLAFVFGDWSRGIESWRFGLPTARGPLGDADAVRAHTVFDRTLLRVGETVSMRHHLRRETARGLARLTGAAQPDTVEIVHQATGESVTLPYRPSMAWTIPAGAKTGVREVTLRRRDGQAWASGQFRVEAFRVPLVEARMQAPEGPQVAPRELAFAVQLRHQSGGGLSAPVALNALLRPAYPQFPDHGDYSFTPPAEPGADGGDGEAPDRVREQVLADRQALRTDAQGAGTARLALPEAVRALKVPAEVVAEVSFDDPNGERQTVGRTVTLWPASVVVGLRARSWLAQGGRVPVQMVVLDPAGRPQAGQEVELRGERRSQTATRQKIVGGFYAYDTKEQVKDLGRLCGGRTDARGLLTCDLDLAETGEVRLIAQARDGTGRASAAATSVWISRGGELWFDQDNDDRIDLLPERRDLRPGETARLQVRMPFREATVLVTVEREGILDARVMTLRGRDPVIEVPVPRASAEAGSWAPNVYVGAMVLRGRVREVPWYSFFQWGWRAPSQWWRAWRDEGPDWVAPTATVDLARPAFKVGTAALRIGLDDHRLTVKVTPEKAQYGIRQTARTAVQVLRPDGQPLAGGTVSFAAVDEGLLALMDNGSWDLLGAMFPPRPWGVETATAHNEIVGRRHHGRKALAPGGGGGRNPTRELFDTLLLWRPEVTLDAQGRATLDVPLNDSLTAFRLVAVAEDGADRFGTGHAAIRVSQDLQMLAGLPSMVREGDRYDALWTLRNTTARAMTVRASLAGPGAPQGAQQVALPAGGAAEVRWPVTVPAGVTTLAWEGAAEEVGGAARDRVRVVQAVEPAVPVRVVQATIRPLAAGAPLSWPVSPPAGALPGVGGLQVSLRPTLAAAQPGLRRWFEAYPYTCLEQRTSRAIGLGDRARWAALMNELPTYLDRDGLAHYFPPADAQAGGGSDVLTAYLLAVSHAAGWTLPEAPREAMLAGLTAFVEGRLARRIPSPRGDALERDVRKLAAIEALSRHGRAGAPLLGSLEVAPAQWPTAALLDWVAILRRVEGVPQRAQRLDEARALLRARLVAGGTAMRFADEAGDGWWWLMAGPDANASRLLLEAVEDGPAWRDDLPRLVTGLTARLDARPDGAFSTTTANTWATVALARFSQAHESAAVAGRARAALGGPSRELDWAREPAGGVLALPWPAPAASGVLTVTQQGEGRPWATLQALAAVPATAPVAAGYRLARRVEPVEQRTAGRLTRGDVLRVTLQVDAMADLGWVVVGDALPPGAVVLGGGLGGDSALATRGEREQGEAWKVHEERLPGLWRAYYAWLPRGTHTVSYTMRLNTAGRFTLPPSRVEAMYAPEHFGETPMTPVEIHAP